MRFLEILRTQTPDKTNLMAIPILAFVTIFFDEY